MSSFAFRRFLLSLVLALPAVPSHADSWTKPTPEELQMTAEAAAPGASAVCLLREERVDDKLHSHSYYFRIKVLTDKGRDRADQEISYNGRRFRLEGVEGRTIHSDGTIVPFTGKPYQKMVDKGHNTKYKATVFTLPDVQTGSILEFRYDLRYEDNLVVSPQWYLPSDLYTRTEHFFFMPSPRLLEDGHGGVIQGRVAWATYLPQGVSVVYSPAAGYYTIDAHDIAAFPEEEWMPPMNNFGFRALFYYTAARTSQEYWTTEGKYWSKRIESFMDAGKLTDIARQLTAPGDTDEQKLKKIYAAVMNLENTSFTREHSNEEDKAEGVRIKTAADVWAQKRGNRDQLDILFVGLARAAGLKAYTGVVVNRDRNTFLQDYLDRSQLDDDIAIVSLGGKELFLDPGERYAEYGNMHWKHCSAQGIRQTDHGTEIFATPTLTYKSSVENEIASIEMEPDGTIKGNLRVILTGGPALYWRQFALRNDEDALKRRMEDSLQQGLPSGVKLKIDHFLGLTSYDSAFMAMFHLEGSLGTATGKRVFLPVAFFESSREPYFSLAKRTTPIDLEYPLFSKEEVTIKLSPAWSVEVLPKDGQFAYAQNAFYQTHFTQNKDTVTGSRTFAVGNIFYKPEELSDLKGFYQKLNESGREPLVLQPSSSASIPVKADGKPETVN